MADEIQDLWGETVATIEMQTPATILRQQASLLGPKTKNLVEAEVKSAPSGNDIVHNFNLVVPTLDGYTYQLFRLLHGPSLYPITIVGGPRAGSGIRDESELMSYLKEVLGSSETTRLVGALKAQARV
jgi:hypothetical protein